MSIFGAKRCVHCKQITLICRQKLADGYLCRKCLKKMKFRFFDTHFHKTADQINERAMRLPITKELKKQFRVTHKYKGVNYDNVHQLVHFLYEDVIYHYKEIIDYTYIQDDYTIGSGRFFSTLVGFELGGLAGGIIGSTIPLDSLYTRLMAVDVYVKSNIAPSVPIRIYIARYRVKTDSLTYQTLCKNTDQLIQRLQSIIDGNIANS